MIIRAVLLLKSLMCLYRRQHKTQNAESPYLGEFPSSNFPKCSVLQIIYILFLKDEDMQINTFAYTLLHFTNKIVSQDTKIMI